MPRSGGAEVGSNHFNCRSHCQHGRSWTQPRGLNLKNLQLTIEIGVGGARGTAGVGLQLMLVSFGWQQRPAASVKGGKKPTAGELHTIVLPSDEGKHQEALTIRLADTDGQRSRANMLLERMYSWRGYRTGQKLRPAPNSITFTATSEEDVIGTLTLTVDSAAGGLASDSTFKDVIDRFRSAPGAKLCELTKFAFDTSTPARPRLAALFHIIFIYGSLHFNCTDLLIEVNPRHRRFYEAMLGFTPIGAPRLNASVNAPAQLMWLNVGEIRRQIDKYAGDERYQGRTLYAHFFSAKEEQGIYGRMAGVRSSCTRSAEAVGAKGGEAEAVQRVYLS